MKITLKLVSILIAFIFVSSCQKPVNTTVPTTSYDVDAKKFIDSSGITDNTQKTAINNFVIQLKDSSLWTKFIAIYPMVGGTANTVKWNLKDPRNSDAAYRLSFYGNPLYASTGVLFPTTADYADSHLMDSQAGGYNNAAMSYYSRTQNTNSGYDMGCTDQFGPYNELSIYSNSLDNSEWFGYSYAIAPANTTGLFMMSSITDEVTRYRNGAVVKRRGAPPINSYTNLTIWIGTSRFTIRSGQKECALATIGNGLTDAQAMTFYNIVQKFQIALGREMN